jgi:S-methylmethionine-dependent homocysteine/selenocysteine methylase
MRCDRFDDLVASNALLRPGPLDSGMHLVYIRRKRGEEPVSYALPELEPILEPTQGVITYQEQVMRIAQTLAGISLAEADVLRKAVGKKDAELIKKELGKFVSKAIAKGHDKKVIEDISGQIETFADTDADMVAAFTMNYVEEAAGLARAAREAGMPVAISFTTETDGRLPSGATLGEAIAATDEASGGHPAYYMINCAHPTHLEPALEGAGSWRDRVRGLRANASRRSHAELDESTDLDAGDPEELGRQYGELRSAFRNLSVVGGCCGTDHRHVAAIGRAMQDALSVR